MPEQTTETTDTHSPRTAELALVEQVIGQLWEEVLAIEPPDRGSRFFAVGGDSITCVRFVAMARSRGVHITVRDVLVDDRLHVLAERAGRVVEPS